MKLILSHLQAQRLLLDMRNRIVNLQPPGPWRTLNVYGVPRGGVTVAYMLAGTSSGAIGFSVVDHQSEADLYVDDLIDSGATEERYKGFGLKPFFALIDKRSPDTPEMLRQWVVFPWEQGDEEGTGIEDNVVRLLQYIGEDPKRGGLKETPKRVAAAWSQWTSGYSVDVPSLFKTFEDGVCDEMVLVKDIPFYSHCEHHMAPFFGTATIGYIPNGKVVGLSKLSRVLDAFARRLQVQERLTVQVADAIAESLTPKGVGVIVKARHLCMESRGVRQQGHHTVTSALRGVMREFSPARAEFLDLAK